MSLTNDKLYEVISIEKDWYRIIDDTGEDYLFSPEKFEIVSFVMQLRQHMGKQATIVTHDHRTFSGKICDYFYPEDNECHAESIVICVGESSRGSHYIEFYEKEICRIYVHL